MGHPQQSDAYAIGWSRLVRDHAGVLVERPLRIVLIVVLAFIARWLLHRCIDRLIRPTKGGQVPRILSPLKERVDSSGWLDAVGLVSERRAQRAATIGSVLKSVASVLVVGFASLLILGQLGLDLAPLIAGTSIVGVALAFGAQNLVKDFLSGMFMILEDQYGVGDVIDFEKATGTVEAVGLRSTRLRDVNGTVWYVRNGEVVRVGNKSQGYAQVVLDIPIDAWADVDAASAAMVAVSHELAAEDDWSGVFLSEPEVQGVEAMTREETTIRLVAKVRPLEQWRTARELRRRIRDRLEHLHIDSHVPPQPEEPVQPVGEDVPPPTSEPGRANRPQPT
jgi:small-conductance mechanosensitive channel